MSATKIHVLKPSVNNLSVRIFVRAAGLDHDEQDAWGHTGSDEFIALNPSRLTPTIEDSELPRAALWESCAIMQYLCNKHGLTQFYPAAPAERAMVDSAMFYLIGTLYPLVARATYPALGFPGYPGEVGTSDADDAAKAAAQAAAREALAGPLEVYRTFFLAGQRFIGGDTPSIADIRLAATIEFLHAVDYELPTWLADYMATMEATLGDAYTEPATDVRGYIDYVRSQAG
jgi:glutathione S-transferase